MTHTHTIPTTSTVMRGKECVLQLDLKIEVECDDGTDCTITAFYLDGYTATAQRDPHLFALLAEGIDKRDMTEKVQALYKWEQDDETGFYTCKGLAA